MRALRLLSLATAMGLAIAQDTTSGDAHCAQGSFNWMFNSLKQDPCTVAQYLGGVCINGNYQVPALATNQVYTGPDPLAANECRCSSVFFSLLSACAICQDGQTLLWDNYDRNCSAVSVGVFPAQIPAGTAVPYWAFMNVTIYGEFNVTYAQKLHGPESTTGSQPAVAPASTQSSPPSHTSSIIVPVVAGVVGGVLALAISVAVVIFLRRRRRRRQRGTTVKLVPTTLDPVDVLLEDKGAKIYPLYPLSSQGTLLYDPSDPRTFPPTPTPLWSRTRDHVSSENISMTTTGSTHSSEPLRFYPGVPEL